MYVCVCAHACVPALGERCECLVCLGWMGAGYCYSFPQASTVLHTTEDIRVPLETILAIKTSPGHQFYLWETDQPPGENNATLEYQLFGIDLRNSHTLTGHGEKV